MENKVLFFDIDGTLIDCSLGIYEIPKTTRTSLQQLQKKGHSLFLATGRCKCFIMEEVMSYPFDGYVTCNGGYVLYQGKEVFKQKIPLEAIQATHDFCEKQDAIYYFESCETIYTRCKEHALHIDFKERWRMRDEVTTDVFEMAEIETYIGMIVLKQEEQVSKMQETLSPYFDMQRHHSGCSFDLTLKGVSKAIGIEALIAVLGKDNNDTVAFGDGRNDVEMLATVGRGIAMGNAADEAKAVADDITDRIENDGITKALQKLSLV